MNRPPTLALVSLLLAVFLVSLGYGVSLPVLPTLVAQLAPAATPNDVVWHTGFVTAIYAGTSLLTAPFWGRIADRSTTSSLIVLSLLLNGLATIAGSFADNLSALYVSRAIAGIGMGTIGPAMQAWLGRWALDDAWRTQRIVWISLASIAGFFVGPLLGGLAGAAGSRLGALGTLGLQLPFLTAGVLVLLASVLVALAVPPAPIAPVRNDSVAGLMRRIAPLLVPLGVVAISVSAFEVALAFTANGRRMEPMQIAVLFAQCTIFMFAAQSFLVMPRFRNRSFRPIIVPALVTMAVGLALTAISSGFVWHSVSTVFVAVGGGLLPPAIAREISVLDDGATGSASGIQAAVNQAGQTVGAILASLIAAAAEPRGAFLVAVVLVLATGVFAVRLTTSSPEPRAGQ